VAIDQDIIKLTSKIIKSNFFIFPDLYFKSFDNEKVLDSIIPIGVVGYTTINNKQDIKSVNPTELLFEFQSDFLF
jgi:hypothetical protein